MVLVSSMNGFDRRAQLVSFNPLFFPSLYGWSIFFVFVFLRAVAKKSTFCQTNQETNFFCMECVQMNKDFLFFFFNPPFCLNIEPLLFASSEHICLCSVQTENTRQNVKAKLIQAERQTRRAVQSL